MTNINLLAEVAKRTESKRKKDKTFATISSLSTEGLLEIRTFMQSLDDRETTWKALMAECRHYGMSTIEPYGISFTITTKIEDDVVQPGSSLFMNMNRIYRESMTNIVKHSNASTVTVELHVSSFLVEMNIRDDGTGFGKMSRSGRGIANMKRRAREAGGKLSIRSGTGSGTFIHLMIDHPKIPHGGHGTSEVLN